jgi:MbtH protein
MGSEAGVAYEVVRNEEGQYAIWLADKPVPPGWEAVGKKGSREECLEYVEEVWTDMRPRSVRERAERGGS